MLIDWENEETHVLHNPKIPPKDSPVAPLLSLGLKGHIWISTSGSNCSKWVALSKEAILLSSSVVNAHLESTNKDVWVSSIPDFHIGGLSIWSRSFLSGAEVVDYKGRLKWDPVAYKECLVENSATLSSLVPAQVYDIVNRQIVAPKKMRAVLVGGGALEETLFERATDLGWKILPTYGLSECASQVATAPLEGLPRLHLLPHIQAKVDDSGQLAIKSNALLTSYVEIKEGEALLLDPKVHGWFNTEDIVEIEGKELRILGRKGDFVKIGGESVSLSVLDAIAEAIKLELDLTEEIALLNLPDDRLGQSIHLVAKSESLRLLAFVDEFQRRVLPFERIRQIHLMPRIPRNSMGKLNRNELRRSLSERTSK